MKRLIEGSIIKIPLLHNLGFTYAKYIDLHKINNSVMYPDALKVFDYKSENPLLKIDEFNHFRYLINPILVAGLRPTLKQNNWQIIGKLKLHEDDFQLPDFKDSDPDIANGKLFLIKGCNRSTAKVTSYDAVKYLQPYMGEGTGNIEIRLTMYFLLKEGKEIKDYFDINNVHYKRKYQQVLDSPIIGA